MFLTSFDQKSPCASTPGSTAEKTAQKRTNRRKKSRGAWTAPWQLLRRGEMESAAAAAPPLLAARPILLRGRHHRAKKSYASTLKVAYSTVTGGEVFFSHRHRPAGPAACLPTNRSEDYRPLYGLDLYSKITLHVKHAQQSRALGLGAAKARPQRRTRTPRAAWWRRPRPPPPRSNTERSQR